MKQFLIKILLFCCLVLAIVLIGGSFVLSDTEVSNFMSAIVDKHKRLTNTKAPRLIFAGGSNLSLGLDSRRIEERLKIPVINMGLHAGLGLDFMLNELKANLKENDIALLCIEYNLGEGDYKLQKNAASYFPQANAYIPHKSLYQKANYFCTEKASSFIQNAKWLTNKLKQNNQSKSINVYNKKYFNEYGDDTAVYHIFKGQNLNNRVKWGEYKEWDGINKINEFNNWAKKRKIKVAFLYPQYPQTEYENNLKFIKDYNSVLQQKLSVPILCTPETFVMQDSLFFDTIYHLNKNGIDKRSMLLVKILEPYLIQKSN